MTNQGAELSRISAGEEADSGLATQKHGRRALVSRTSWRQPRGKGYTRGSAAAWPSCSWLSNKS